MTGIAFKKQTCFLCHHFLTLKSTKVWNSLQPSLIISLFFFKDQKVYTHLILESKYALKEVLCISLQICRVSKILKGKNRH